MVLSTWSEKIQPPNRTQSFSPESRVNDQQQEIIPRVEVITYCHDCTQSTINI